MKKLIISIALGLGLMGTGCATLTNWYDQVSSNPAQVVQLFDTTAQTVMSDASIAWSVIEPGIPAADQAAATTSYQTAVVTANNAITAINAALQADIAAKATNPDLSAVLSAATTAIGAVVAIVNQYGGHLSAPTLGASAPVPGLNEANTGLVVLKNWH